MMSFGKNRVNEVIVSIVKIKCKNYKISIEQYRRTKTIKI